MRVWVGRCEGDHFLATHPRFHATKKEWVHLGHIPFTWSLSLPLRAWFACGIYGMPNSFCPRDGRSRTIGMFFHLETVLKTCLFLLRRRCFGWKEIAGSVSLRFSGKTPADDFVIQIVWAFFQNMWSGSYRRSKTCSVSMLANVQHFWWYWTLRLPWRLDSPAQWSLFVFGFCFWTSSRGRIIILPPVGQHYAGTGFVPSRCMIDVSFFRSSRWKIRMLYRTVWCRWMSAWLPLKIRPILPMRPSTVLILVKLSRIILGNSWKVVDTRTRRSIKQCTIGLWGNHWHLKSQLFKNFFNLFQAIQELFQSFSCSL